MPLSRLFSCSRLATICLVMLCCQSRVWAQVFSNRRNSTPIGTDQRIQSDTSKKNTKWRAEKVRITHFTLQDSTRQSPDSSIQFLHRNPIQTNWFQDLGNLGTPGKSLCYNYLPQASLQSGLQSMNTYLLDERKATYFNTTRPYTDIYYHMGTKQEQVLDLLHTQNVFPYWNLSARYRKIGSPGFFKQQRSNHDQLLLTSYYKARNDRYVLHAAMSYNKFQLDENGGIANEDFLDAAIYTDRRVLPVIAESYGSGNQSSIKNYLRRAAFLLDHVLYLGRTDSLRDSVGTSRGFVFKPRLGIRHQLYGESNYYRYLDRLPDSNFYAALGPTDLQVGDSIKTRYAWNQWGTQMGLQLILNSRAAPLYLEAGLGFEQLSISNEWNNQLFAMPFLYAQLRKNLQSNNVWEYQAGLKSFLTGYNAGSYTLNFVAGRKLGSGTTRIKLAYYQNLNRPEFFNSAWYSNLISQQNNLNRMFTQSVDAGLENTKQQWQVNLRGFLHNQFIYRDTTLTVKQYQGGIPVLVLQGAKTFQWRKWVLFNQMAFQYSSDSTPIHLPRWIGRHRLAYENFILRSKLQVATGIEIAYHTPYLADGYHPYVFSTFTQYQRTLSNYPMWTAFFNFKVKRFRATVMADQLQQLFTRNYMNFPFYPNRNFNLRFGFHWVFVN